MKRYELLGIPVDSINQDEIYSKLLTLSNLNKSCQVTLLDTYLLMKAQFSKELKAAIQSSSLVIPISPGIRIALKFLKVNIDKVYNYYNFIINLLLRFTDESKFIYILGGKKKIIDKIYKNLLDSFPGIRLVGKYHRNYEKHFEKDLITAIQKASPALVLVGNRAVDQEKWIFRRRGKFNKGVFIGVRNFLNIVGGRGKSPSEKSIQSGMFSFKKLIKNPFKIFYYILFVILLILSKIFGRRNRNN